MQNDLNEKWQEKAADFLLHAYLCGFLPLNCEEVQPGDFKTREDWHYATRRRMTAYLITGK